MSKRINRESQNHTEAEIFSYRNNRTIINTKMEEKILRENYYNFTF